MFLIIILSGIMGLIATDLFVPSMPSIAILFHQTPNQTELTISLFLVGFSIAQLFYGPISDAIGRRVPLLIGTLLFVLGSIFCTVAPTFTLLCIGRVIQGIGAAAGTSLMRVILRDRYQGVLLAEKSSQAAIFVSLTPAIAPFFGGLLQEFFGFRSTFIFMLAFGTLLAGLLIFSFKETLLKKDNGLTVKSTLKNYSSLLQNTLFIKNVCATGIAYAIVIIYVNITPFIVQNTLHFTALESGASILFAALGICSGAIFSRKYVAKIGSSHLISVGFLLLTSSGFLLILSFILFGTRLYFLMPFIYIATLTCGLIFPNAMALAFSTITSNIGVAGAIYGTAQVAISMLANFLLNMIHDQNQLLLGLIYFLMGTAGLLMSYEKVAYKDRLGEFSPKICKETR